MRKNYKFRLALFIFLAFLIFFITHLIHHWQPVLQAMAEMQANALATDILADTMRDVLIETDIQSEDLVTYYYNPSGEVFAYSIDTVTIEKLAALANTKMGEFLEEKKEFELDIPLGRVTNNPLLAAMGPDIPIQVRVVGNPGVDYGRSFESVGINEINHRIWIEMELLIQVTTPLLTDVLEANMEFTLIDQTLSGKVPNTYLGLD